MDCTGTGSELTTILTVLVSVLELLLILILLLDSDSKSPSSEVVRQELVLTSEYSDGTALMGLGGFLGDELAGKEFEIIRVRKK